MHMNIFKPITLEWWQVGIFKLSLLSLGVFIGAYWADIFAPWTTTLLVIFVVTALYLFPVWWKNWKN